VILPAVRGERNGLLSRSAESQRESREHYELGVKLDAGDASDAKRCERVVVLQASEFALDGDAAAVEVAD